MIDILLIEEHAYSENELDEICPSLREFTFSKGILRASQEEFKFQFVGLIAFKGKLIYVLPKYFEKTTAAHRHSLDFPKYYNRLLMKCFKSQEFLINCEDFEIKFDNTFSLYIKLLEYYQTYGLYMPLNIKVSNSYEDRVNWASTVDTYAPIFINKRPLYLDVISSKTEQDLSHVITEFQKFATKQAFENFGQYIIDESLFIDAIEIFDFYEEDYLQQILISKRNETFVDHEIYLINLLLDFIDDNNRETALPITLFGTTAFYHIWETACRFIVEESNEKKLFFRPAAWFIDHGRYIGSGKPIPDIFKIQQNTIYILDAKYYVPSFSNRKASNEPGTESISKQIMYELTVKNHILYSQTRGVYNGFILPFYDETQNISETFNVLDSNCHSGTVLYRSTSLPSINVLKVPVHLVFNTFMQNKRINLNL